MATTTKPSELAGKAEGQSQGRFYRPELDVLRFFAFLAVFVHHEVPAFPGQSSGVIGKLSRAEWVVQDAGAFGVSIFFFLSAYLITSLLMIEKHRTGTVHVRAFYVRRMLRIWPLYFGFLLVGFALSKVYAPFAVSEARWLAFIFLAGNWYTARHGFPANPISPLWSVSLEEQFYILWPCLFRTLKRQWLVWLSITLVPLSWLTMIWLARSGADPNSAIWANSLVQFQFFGLGTFFAIVLYERHFAIPKAFRIFLVAVGLTFWALSSGFAHLRGPADLTSPAKIWAGYVFLAAGCLAIFFALLEVRVPRAVQPLVFLGKISYGLYVFHVLCLYVVHRVLVTALHWNAKVSGEWFVVFRRAVTVNVLALALTIAVSAASYLYFEKPFLKIKERFAFVRSRRA